MLSFIVPCYNAESTIGRCLKSILALKRKDVEVIVVDDGSSDNTVSEINSFNDERLILIRQENCGVSAARNTGLSVAKGNMISFVDADDEILAVEYTQIMDSVDSDVLFFPFDILWGRLSENQDEFSSELN